MLEQPTAAQTDALIDIESSALHLLQKPTHVNQINMNDISSLQSKCELDEGTEMPQPRNKEVHLLQCSQLREGPASTGM